MSIYNYPVLGFSTIGALSVPIYSSGTYTNSQRVYRYICIDSLQLPISLSGSIFELTTAPTSTATFTIKKNSVDIGTISFASGNTNPTITFSTVIGFTPSDRLDIVAPTVADGTAAGLVGTLKIILTA